MEILGKHNMHVKWLDERLKKIEKKMLKDVTSFNLVEY